MSLSTRASPILHAEPQGILDDDDRVDDVLDIEPETSVNSIRNTERLRVDSSPEPEGNETPLARKRRLARNRQRRRRRRIESTEGLSHSQRSSRSKTVKPKRQKSTRMKRMPRKPAKKHVKLSANATQPALSQLLLTELPALPPVMSPLRRLPLVERSLDQFSGNAATAYTDHLEVPGGTAGLFGDIDFAHFLGSPWATSASTGDVQAAVTASSAILPTTLAPSTPSALQSENTVRDISGKSGARVRMDMLAAVSSQCYSDLRRVKAT